MAQRVSKTCLPGPGVWAGRFAAAEAITISHEIAERIIIDPYGFYTMCLDEGVRLWGGPRALASKILPAAGFPAGGTRWKAGTQPGLAAPHTASSFELKLISMNRILLL